MLITRPVLDCIAVGEIDLVFRRWRRPTVKPGGRLRTAVGELAIDAVDVVEPTCITATQARRAGYASRSELLADLGRRTQGDVHRVRVHLAGPDARVALRSDALLGSADVTALDVRLDRLDRASRRGAWTRTVLELVAARPAVRAPDLAASLGLETAQFKQDVRKLKELGLTESLTVGYRLSPRGRASLRRIQARAPRP